MHTDIPLAELRIKMARDFIDYYKPEGDCSPSLTLKRVASILVVFDDQCSWIANEDDYGDCVEKMTGNILDGHYDNCLNEADMEEFWEAVHSDFSDDCELFNSNAGGFTELQESISCEPDSVVNELAELLGVDRKKLRLMRDVEHWRECAKVEEVIEQVEQETGYATDGMTLEYDSIIEQFREAVVSAIIDSGHDYRWTQVQSVGVGAIVQNHADRDACDDVLDKAITQCRPYLVQWIREYHKAEAKEQESI